MAARGCRVILAVRSNGDETKDKITKETNNPNVIAKHIDLLSLESVRKFAEDFNETEERLDILILNAGVSCADYLSEDGLNAAMQINHFSQFLLANLLSGTL